MRAHHTLSRHRPRKRAIQYSEAPMMESIGRSVLDTPLEPVIGLAEGETRWRSMTIFARKRRRFHLSFCGGGYGLLRGACHPARVRATERDAGYIDLSNSIQPPKRPILIKAEHRIRREPGRMGFVTGTATAQAYEPRYIRLDPNDNVHSRTGDLEHDPEKWVPVFPRDKREAFARRSCSNKKIERDDDSKKSHPALDRPPPRRDADATGGVEDLGFAGFQAVRGQYGLR